MNKTLLALAAGASLVGASVFSRDYLPGLLSWLLILAGACLLGVGLIFLILDLMSKKDSAGSPPAGGKIRPPEPRPVESRNVGAEVSSAVTELRKQVDRLAKEVDGISDIATVSELKLRADSLQKTVQSSQADLRLAKDSLAAERRSLESCESDKEALRAENVRLHDELRRLGSALQSVSDSRDKLLSTESDRLAQMVPAGLLDSSIGQSVRWCAEASAKGDRIAAQFFASLQSIKAAQGDDELKGLLLSSLHVLGQSLARLSEREAYSPQQKCDVLSNWASVLNEISGSRFTLIVPSIGARVNLNTMVRNGPAAGNVTAVHCWGVMNENGDLYSPASVS